MRSARVRGNILLVLLLFASVITSGGGSIPYEWSGVERIVAVGDLHGDYENFVKILKATEIVDNDLHWVAGKTHLVQTGDIMDRWDEARNILDLLMRLEEEAVAAGGMVHVLLGNHEEINITGIVFSYPDFMTLDQFISFLPDAYRRQAEKDLQKKIQRGRASGGPAPPEQLINEFWTSLRNDPGAQRQYVLGFNRKYGSWLMKKNVVIKINDTVFVHGGLNEKYAAWGIEEINNRYRLELKDLWRAIESGTDPNIARPILIYKGDGPLWYRELATVAEADIEEELDRTLALLEAKHMVIAHTPRVAATTEKMKRFGGKVWIVDTGISRVFGGRLGALIIQNGEFLVRGANHEQNKEPSLAASPLLPLLGRELDLLPASL
ncbi:MAG: metallophosphoesterase [Acidobacteriota bacterium]